MMDKVVSECINRSGLDFIAVRTDSCLFAIFQTGSFLGHGPIAPAVNAIELRCPGKCVAFLSNNISILRIRTGLPHNQFHGNRSPDIGIGNVKSTADELRNIRINVMISYIRKAERLKQKKAVPLCKPNRAEKGSLKVCSETGISPVKAEASRSNIMIKGNAVVTVPVRVIFFRLVLNGIRSIGIYTVNRANGFRNRI